METESPLVAAARPKAALRLRRCGRGLSRSLGLRFVVNDGKDHKPLLETGLDIVGTVVGAKGLKSAGADTLGNRATRQSVVGDAESGAAEADSGARFAVDSNGSVTDTDMTMPTQRYNRKTQYGGA